MLEFRLFLVRNVEILIIFMLKMSEFHLKMLKSQNFLAENTEILTHLWSKNPDFHFRKDENLDSSESRESSF